MTFLDTDHLTVLGFRESAKYGILTAKLQTSGEEVATTIVSIEEQLRGILALIKHQNDVHQQIPRYEQLGRLLSFLRDCQILPFDQRAADMFKQFRKQKVRIGSQDLKIAAIAVTCDALLLSADLRDFRQVPGLRVENWLEA